MCMIFSMHCIVCAGYPLVQSVLISCGMAQYTLHLALDVWHALCPPPSGTRNPSPAKQTPPHIRCATPSLGLLTVWPFPVVDHMADASPWQGLSSELDNIVDNFTNMIRASRIPDEEPAELSGQRKVPGACCLPPVFLRCFLVNPLGTFHVAGDLHCPGLATAQPGPSCCGRVTCVMPMLPRTHTGDLLEVWAEKLLFSAFMSLHHISELKKAAALSDVNTQILNGRAVKLTMTNADESIAHQLAGIKGEAQVLLGQLEDAYYSSRHKGRPTESGVSQELRELCHLALEAPIAAAALQQSTGK